MSEAPEKKSAAPAAKVEGYKPDPAKLAEVLDDIYACAGCGYCRFGCPVFREVGFERLSPRGRILALKRAIETRTDVPASIRDSIYMCAQCENCKIQCPVGVDFVKISELLRKDMAERGMLPESQLPMKENLAREANPYGQPQAERGAWAGPQTRLEKGVPDLFFVGCGVSYGSNRIAKSVARVLDSIGMKFNVLGAEENCCGAPLFRLGEEQAAMEMVERNIKKFDELGVKRIFSTCAGCFKTLKQLYPDRFRVQHVSQLLLELVKSGRIQFGKELKKKIIYFDGCDIGRHAGVYEEPREFLKAIPGVELLEYDYNRDQALCCGGPLLSLDAELASRIAADRVREAVEKGAEMIVTPCPTCMLTLKDGAKTAGIRMDVQDLPMLLPSLLKREKKE